MSEFSNTNEKELEERNIYATANLNVKPFTDKNPEDKPFPIPNRYVQLFRWSISRLLVLVFLVVLIAWIVQVEGSFGFKDASVFGWHALFMALFVVVFTQEALLSFSSPLLGGPFTRDCGITSIVKDLYYHLVCHFLGLISWVLGIVAIVYYKELSPQPASFPFYSVYSPHSWLGIALLALWGIQILMGIYCHVWAKPDEKLILVKIHQFLGKVIYVLGLATCAMGLQDMQSSDLAGSTPPMPMVGSDDMNMGDNMGMIMANGSLMNMTGYYPHSMYAQYASGCSILLLFIGIAVFGILTF